VTAGLGRAEQVLDQLDTGIVGLDEAGRIVYMNSAAEQGLLISRDQARGRHLGEVAAMPDELHAAIDRLPRAGEGIRFHELRLGEGLFDCTIQSFGEHRLLLEFRNLEWEQMRLSLAQREVQTGMLELLSRNLGHEVRNPLGGIRGAAQLLADELESPELITLARLIMRESDRIDELIQRFGQPELDKRDVDLYPLVDEALDLMLAEFGSGVSVERDFDPSIPPIMADVTAIRQVILNLLRNACQAGASMLLIRTRIQHGDGLLQAGKWGSIRLDIVDDGQGVPESLRSLLFLPLVTGRRDGTGLGLALSQQIAAAHGGLLTFEPLEQGSRFSLHLPFGDAGTSGQEDRTS
jgi:two-component system nitrogen regulation sensor histidine kinase GlnL